MVHGAADRLRSYDLVADAFDLTAGDQPSSPALDDLDPVREHRPLRHGPVPANGRGLESLASFRESFLHHGSSPAARAEASASVSGYADSASSCDPRKR